MNLQLAHISDLKTIFDLITQAKIYLKQQGIDQWQKGYPDKTCIKQDIKQNKGYLIVDENCLIGYLCIDFDGETAYEQLQGKWKTKYPYVVVHRLAFASHVRGKGLAGLVFKLVEELSKQRGVYAFRIDTDAENKAMQHILAQQGFTYRGTIWFDNSEKIAFDKTIR